MRDVSPAGREQIAKVFDGVAAVIKCRWVFFFLFLLI